MYYWQFSVIADNILPFFGGLCSSVFLALACIVCSTLLGIALALARTSPARAVSGMVDIFVLFFRSIPVLVLLVWLYYAMPAIANWGAGAFETAFIAISLSGAVYISEDVRSGIESIPKGQTDAAKNLGLSWLQTSFHIILPQSLRKIRPVLLNEYVTLAKFTSLASIIGVHELMHVGSNLIAMTYRPLEIYTAVALGYLSITLPLVILAKKFEEQAG